MPAVKPYARVTASIPNKLFDALCKLAREDNRTLSGEVVSLLQEAVAARGVDQLTP